MRILVVDDDLSCRLMAKAVVEALGHDCVTAPDGDTAWQLYRSDRPDVLISDWAMPGMDGTELCRAVRAVETGSYTYIVLLTGMTAPQDVLAGMRAGADDYVPKPLRPLDLEARLLAGERVTRLHAELARARAQLDERAHTDPLTGLRNRLGLADDLAALHSSAQRYGRPYCIALCDVDHFKRYNDTYGHLAGDEALRSVGRVLSAGLRPSDRVYRWGGEEFLVLLPEQTAGGGLSALTRLCRQVEDLRLPHDGGGPQRVLTMSVGLAWWGRSRSAPGTTCEQVLAEADRALYAAKAEGRNRVVAGSPHEGSAVPAATG